MSDDAAPAFAEGTLDVLATLRDPATIRARCAAITAAVADGRSGWFTLDRSRLDDAAARVAALTRRRFPDLCIPYHSRWRHFEAGGVDRKRELDALLAPLGRDDRLRAMVDLTVVSVLLDAGAGPRWRYTERVPAAADTAAPAYSRSEGLGVASFRAFVQGVFSADEAQPARVDASALALLDATALRAMFQVTAANPMVGLEGRAGLLARLGDALTDAARREGGSARPCRVIERATRGFTLGEVSAQALLQEVLRAYAPIWTSGTVVRGAPAGDVWPHRWAGAATARGADPYTDGLVPFHKLSQWLTYSLLEPLQWAGVAVTGVDALTGLPEYRNGGLLIDSGVIVPRAPRDLEQPRKPGDELVVEWRALTVTLLDELAQRVRAMLGMSPEALPLACVLEGGTWMAGREIAGERRDGAPPLRIDSDGTVF